MSDEVSQHAAGRDSIFYHLSNRYIHIENTYNTRTFFQSVVERKHKPFKVTDVFSKRSKRSTYFNDEKVMLNDYAVMWYQPKHQSYECVYVRTHLNENGVLEYLVGDRVTYSLTPVPMLLSLHEKIDRLLFITGK